jgi:hypothetical protein
MMCDFNPIAGFVIAAQTAFLASLGILLVGSGLASNPFTSVANIGLMIAAGISAALASGFIAAAIAFVDKCSGGVCAPQVAALRSTLLQLAIALGVFAGLLVGLAILAPVPFAGAVAIAGVLIWAVSAVTLFAATVSGYLARDIQAFNSCQERNSASSNSNAATVIVVLSILTIAAVLLLNGVGAYEGWIPRTLSFD